MIKDVKKCQKWVIVTIVLLMMGVVNYILSSINPLRGDDLMYQYFCSDMTMNGLKYPFDNTNRIDDFYEALLSICNFYFLENGRVLIHYLDQCFCGFLGKHIFDYLNSIVYILFLFGSLQLLRINKITESIFFVSLLWLGLPLSYIYTVSISFALNYLWVSTMFVFFLLMLRSIVDNKKALSWYSSFLVLLGMLMGATHEGFSLPLSGALFLYCIIHYLNPNKRILLLTLGLCIGTAFVVFAPGTMHRGASKIIEYGDFVDIIRLKFSVIYYSKRFLLLVLLSAIGYFSFGSAVVKEFFKEHQIAFYTIVLGLLFVMAIPHYTQRMVFPVELLSFYLCFHWLRQYDFYKKYLYIFTFFGVLLISVHIPLTIYYSRLVIEEYNDLISRYIDSPEGKTHGNTIYIPKPFKQHVERVGEFEYEMISFEYGKKMIVEEKERED